MTEIWKDVEGFEGLYMVSSEGRVISLPRKGHGGRTTERIMSGGLCSGYYALTLCKSPIIKRVQIHRLVAIAFIPNPENKPEVNHKNGIKTDNRLINLEWCTASENAIHKVKNGLVKTACGSQKSNSKFTEQQVSQIKARLKSGEIGHRIAKELGVGKWVIGNIRKGISWKHVV